MQATIPSSKTQRRLALPQPLMGTDNGIAVWIVVVLLCTEGLVVLLDEMTLNIANKAYAIVN